MKRYTEREKTRLDHVWEIQQAFGLRDFASYEAELTAKLDAHAWNTGDGPTAMFQDAVRWLRENDVLLPGITTLTRLVARARDQATQRLYTTLAEIPNQSQRQLLDQLLDIEPGGRMSKWERWRTGPVKASAPAMSAVLALVAEVAGSGPVLPNVSPATNCAVVPGQRCAKDSSRDWSCREPALSSNVLTCRDALPCGWGHVREHWAVSAVFRSYPKKQQMRWSPHGAHLFLQVRIRVLNNDLAADFARWYPGFTHHNEPVELAA